MSPDEINIKTKIIQNETRINQRETRLVQVKRDLSEALITKTVFESIYNDLTMLSESYRNFRLGFGKMIRTINEQIQKKKNESDIASVFTNYTNELEKINTFGNRTLTQLNKHLLMFNQDNSKLSQLPGLPGDEEEDKKEKANKN